MAQTIAECNRVFWRFLAAALAAAAAGAGARQATRAARRILRRMARCGASGPCAGSLASPAARAIFRLTRRPASAIHSFSSLKRRFRGPLVFWPQDKSSSDFPHGPASTGRG
jgi:hypothetical protein